MKKFFLILILSSGSLVFAQEKDYGAWFSLSGRYEITKKIRLDVSEELRTISSASATDQYFTDLGLSYKFNKYISLGGYYRFIRKKEDDDQFYSRNRFYGDLTLIYSLKRFEFTYRYRLQRQVNQFKEYVRDKEPKLYNRHKLEMAYNIPNFKLTPSIFYERFYRLNYYSSYFADNVRYGFGLDYKFNKKHRISIGYLIDKDLHPKTRYLKVLTLGYRFTLK